jgi:hypothetical protein
MIDRLIIQTALTEGIRSLFDNHDEPNGLDYAINEILYGRTILLTAIEDALGVGNEAGARHNISSSSSSSSASLDTEDPLPENANEWTERHRAAIDSLREGLRSTANAATNLSSRVVQSLRGFARDLQLSWNASSSEPMGTSSTNGEETNSSQERDSEQRYRFLRNPRYGNPNGTHNYGRQEPLLTPETMDHIQRDLGRSVKFALEVVGLVATGLTHVLVEVGSRVATAATSGSNGQHSGAMREEDPFSGVYGYENEEFFSRKSDDEEEETPLERGRRRQEQPQQQMEENIRIPGAYVHSTYVDEEEQTVGTQATGFTSNGARQRTEPLGDGDLEASIPDLEAGLTTGAPDGNQADELVMYENVVGVSERRILDDIQVENPFLDPVETDSEGDSFLKEKEEEEDLSATSFYSSVDGSESNDSNNNSNRIRTASNELDLYLSISTSMSSSTSISNLEPSTSTVPIPVSPISVEVVHDEDSESSMSKVPSEADFDLNKAPSVSSDSDSDENETRSEGAGSDDFVLVKDEEEDNSASESGDDGDSEAGDLRSSTLVFPVL